MSMIRSMIACERHRRMKTVVILTIATTVILATLIIALASQLAHADSSTVDEFRSEQILDRPSTRTTEPRAAQENIEDLVDKKAALIEAEPKVTEAASTPQTDYEEPVYDEPAEPQPAESTEYYSREWAMQQPWWSLYREGEPYERANRRWVESRGDYAANTGNGYLGAYQFAEQYMQGRCEAYGFVWPGVEGFLADPGLQDACADAYALDRWGGWANVPWYGGW